MARNPSCQSPAARAEALPEPLAWFAGMIDHCYDYAEAAKTEGRPIVGILCEFTPREIILAAGAVPVCLSAPLSAGIAVTHRDRASSVAIVTGHNADGNDDRLDWCALSKVDTLVVLMGVHNVAHIAKHLMAAGRSADTPAAAVQRAFWPGESVISATLGTIADEVRRAHVEAPATLVIGEVVSLREKLKYYQQHIGQIHMQAVEPASAADTSIPVVPLPELPTGGEPGLDALNLEEESCAIPIPCEKETLQ